MPKEPSINNQFTSEQLVVIWRYLYACRDSVLTTMKTINSVRSNKTREWVREQLRYYHNVDQWLKSKQTHVSRSLVARGENVP